MGNSCGGNASILRRYILKGNKKMRKITFEAQDAFWNDRNFKKDNTVVKNGVCFLHDTKIALIKDDCIIINSGGYRTNTTKERLNGILLSVGYIIVQEKNKWFVCNMLSGEIIDFIDNIKIKVRLQKNAVNR